VLKIIDTFRFLVYNTYMNNQEKITNTLVSLGLTNHEAKIYLAVLERGSANITDIARDSQINRTALYLYIDNLLKQDLLKKTFKGKRIYYIPTNPKKLLTILEKRKQKAQEILPTLTNLYNTSSAKPVIKFYEGKEGMRSIYREMTKTPQILWSMFSADRYYNAFNQKDGEEFLNNIYESGGQLRDLVKNTPEGKRYVKENTATKVGKSKLLPKDFDFEVDLMVSGNKISMISLTNLVGVVIENKEMAKLQKNFLQFIWKRI
jgi:sugar-specific transcriptional regulator TrmB